MSTFFEDGKKLFHNWNTVAWKPLSPRQAANELYDAEHTDRKKLAEYLADSDLVIGRVQSTLAFNVDYADALASLAHGALMHTFGGHVYDEENSLRRFSVRLGSAQDGKKKLVLNGVNIEDEDLLAAARHIDRMATLVSRKWQVVNTPEGIIYQRPFILGDDRIELNWWLGGIAGALKLPGDAVSSYHCKPDGGLIGKKEPVPENAESFVVVREEMEGRKVADLLFKKLGIPHPRAHQRPER